MAYSNCTTLCTGFLANDSNDNRSTCFAHKVLFRTFLPRFRVRWGPGKNRRIRVMPRYIGDESRWTSPHLSGTNPKQIQGFVPKGADCLQQMKMSLNIGVEGGEGGEVRRMHTDPSHISIAERSRAHLVSFVDPILN